MTLVKDKSDWSVSGLLAVMLTIMVAAAQLTPYVVVIPKDNMNLIIQGQTTLWAGWLLMLGYYYGTTNNTGKKDATISTLALTAKTAQETLSATNGITPSEVIPVAPGETKTIEGTS